MSNRITRSGRVIKNSSTSQAKLDALEILARQRRGEKVERIDTTLEEGGESDGYEDEEFDGDEHDDYDDDDVQAIRRNEKKSEKNSANLDDDDILKQMLIDVPTNRASAIKKPIRHQVRSGSSANTTPVSKPLKTKALFDSISAKRPRISSPPLPSAEPDESFDSFTDESKFDIKPIDTKPIIFSSGDTEPNDDVGISAVPLNEDLRSNLEFHDHEGKQCTRMYWYDCVEDQQKFPGVVYFFGRIFIKAVKRYVSCCTVVKNIKRTCYLLIAPGSTYEEVVAEFSNITAKQHKIKNFSCQKVTKKYAFSSDPTIPLESDYVQVQYFANQAIVPVDMNGQTFSKVFNVNQSPMEKIILDLKLRGPCWLKLIDPVTPSSQLTWSRIELVLEEPNQLMVEPDQEKMDVPYFCAFSLSIRTYPNPTTHKNEIIAIAGMVNTCFKLDECLKRTNKASGHFLIMTKPPPAHKDLRLPHDFQRVIKNYKKTIFELVDSERDLLLKFMDRFNNLDPDIVVGHDLMNFDFETLVMRMNIMKVGVWSKLGRFRRSELPQTKAAFKYMFSGRVMCDIKMSAMELIKARSYDLTELSLQILDKKRREYDHTNILDAFKSSESLIQMLNETWEDNDSIFSILVELNVIPLALKITNITGNILSRTLAAGRSERNEYLLLHAFHEANFICPEKQISKFKRGPNVKNELDDNKETNPARKKAAYTGGLVLEPKAGYYDTCILLMDFNSLYPSIIQEFNICFSTVKAPPVIDDDPNTEIIASVPPDSASAGILPAQLRNLVERRRNVKRQLEDSKLAAQKLMLDIEQKALKLTANSMYGCLGFEQSRFYAKHLASLVTFKGREILMSTKAMVEQLGFEVIYGDTDSLMINTKISDFDEVMQRGNSIKGEVNRTFKLLEIDIDGVYKPLLLLKKKNYAGVSIKKVADSQLQKSIETKGLDTVRRDRAVIAKEVGERVLDMILNGDKDIDQIVEDIHNYLKTISLSINNGEIPVEKFFISKQLNRHPEEYRDTKALGHVALALRHNNDPKNTRKYRAGDTMVYVICLDGSNDSANQRAYSLHEMSMNENLKIDYEYYLCQQIHPVMTRICDKLPTTNAYTLAEMLGIEKSNLLHLKADDSGGVRRDQLASKGEARFHSCKALQIKCPNCNLPDDICSRTRKGIDGKLEFSLSRCPSCGIKYAMQRKQIVSQIINHIKKLTLELYCTQFICENSECNNRTRNIFRFLTTSDSGETRALPVCDLCDSSMLPEMDDRKMDLQLSYLRHLLNIERIQVSSEEEKIQASEELLVLYRECIQEVNYALRNSFINNIDTHLVFSMICSVQAK